MSWADLDSSLRSYSDNVGSTRTTFWNELYEKPRVDVLIFAARRKVSGKFIFIIGTERSAEGDRRIGRRARSGEKWNLWSKYMFVLL